jgi:hypothetical protein
MELLWVSINRISEFPYYRLQAISIGSPSWRAVLGSWGEKMRLLSPASGHGKHMLVTGATFAGSGRVFSWLAFGIPENSIDVKCRSPRKQGLVMFDPNRINADYKLSLIPDDGWQLSGWETDGHVAGDGPDGSGQEDGVLSICEDICIPFILD